MKKIDRRSFLKATAAVSVAGALGACSSSTSTTTSTTTTSTTSTSTDSSAEQITLKAASWDLTSNLHYQAVADAYMAQNLNVTIEMIDIPSADYSTKINIMLNASSDVDVFWIKESNKAYEYSAKGQLLDLTSYVEESGMDLDDFNGIAECFQFDGKTLAIPAQTQYYNLYYNKDLFDAAGVDYPTNDMTWSEFVDVAYQMTSGEGSEKIYGAYFHTWLCLVTQWGIQNGEHDVMATNYADYLTESFEMVLGMQEDGVIKDYATAKTSSLHYSTEFYSGQVAMLPIGNWFSAMIIAKQEAGEFNANWGMVTIPHTDDVEAGYTVGSTTAIAACANTAYADAAWDFINFVVGPEGGDVYVSMGNIPGASTDEHLEMLATVAGMPEETEQIVEALQVKNFELDFPISELSSEINTMMSEEYDLIMLGESTIEEGLAAMTERSIEIQGL